MPFRTPLVGLSQTADVSIGDPTKAQNYNFLRNDVLRALTSFDEDTSLTIVATVNARNHAAYATDTDEIFFYWDSNTTTPSRIAAYECEIRGDRFQHVGEGPHVFGDTFNGEGGAIPVGGGVFEVSSSAVSSFGTTDSLLAATYFYHSFTANNNNTGPQAQFAIGGNMTTQGDSDTVPEVSTLHLREPDISVGTGDTVTIGSTLCIWDEPDEGTTNFGFHNRATSLFDDTVAIGTGSPSATLHVVATTNTTSGAIIDTDPTSPSEPPLVVRIAGTDQFVCDEADSGGRRFTLGGYDNGTGIGRQLLLGRNSNVTTPASGHLRISDAGGTAQYVWPDDSASPGDLRIGTTLPTNANDTSGTVVGTQSSWHALKKDIEPWDGEGAIETILNTPLWSYRFQGDGKRGSKLMHGIVIHEDDRRAWYAMNGADNQIPALDEANVQGNLLGAVKKLVQKIDEQQAEIDFLKEELRDNGIIVS